MKWQGTKRPWKCGLCQTRISANGVFWHFYNKHWMFWRANKDHLDIFISKVENKK